MFNILYVNMINICFCYKCWKFFAKGENNGGFGLIIHKINKQFEAFSEILVEKLL